MSQLIRNLDSSISDLEWLSPLKNEEYVEIGLRKVPGLENESFSFWPSRHPQWDAVAIDEQDKIILVEAKGHVEETRSRCASKNDKNLATIKEALADSHKKLTTKAEYGIKNSHPYDEQAWLNKYYQLGNRLSFLTHLRENGYNVKLVLLNFVHDQTHIPTTLAEWTRHYEEVFQLLLGSERAPENVLLVNFNVDLMKDHLKKS